MDAVSKTVAEAPKACVDCTCLNDLEKMKDSKNPEEIERMMLEREAVLRREFLQKLEGETNDLKDKFDYILQNEQVRTSFMLREAHRERQEKIGALQTQLECKNLAGVMYVMCTERRKSKLERLRLIQEYTNYIRALQTILADGQELILRLSRGYKTAARVDHEWREKMKMVIKEFQAYVYHFSGGTPESNQYLFDLPALLKTEASVYDDPKEDPIEEPDHEGEEEEAEDPNAEKPWWELIEGECKPFIMFGDMAEFRPPQRREVLKAVKAAATAPRHWKEYVFNDMFLRADCSNADVIKDEYPNRVPPPGKWECQAVQTDRQFSKMSISSRRVTTTSMDVRGNMGSILKIITSNIAPEAPNKPNILAARDSMEIASTTKLRDKHHHKHTDPARVVINVGSRRTSMFKQDLEDTSDEVGTSQQKKELKDLDDEEEDESLSLLGSIHNDSLHVIPSHVPEKDHKIHYEKVCPMEKCQRMEVDSFIRSLPPYMRANPFTHFEQSYEDYETCTKACHAAIPDLTGCEVAAKTEQGYVCGRIRNATNGAKYASFRGMQYGTQPLGELRFKELLPPPSFDGLFNATEAGPICAQVDVLYTPNNLVAPLSSGEDCIRINVHVPYDYLPAINATSNSSNLLPVMFWIHGGAFSYGSGDADVHGPEYLMTKDVILVTINYRLHVFGFLSLDNEYIPGNNGLRDCITALKWVQSNIRNFGGDPARVTISGESAGAVMTHLLSISNATQGLFQSEPTDGAGSDDAATSGILQRDFHNS
ncbi:uncharacterized protein LOC114365532 isoform X2 [Ostrinia furnacalis]|uniref:uncharacterized protein LOC114365532 isoform X2 n=1 Tax=Ostrinia furnacalis TaxID=93504 RepID=UPI00103E5FA6|nr:uncharacterized protein LOC114365532 isoform X2 [Ostrinia furnacalis]